MPSKSKTTSVNEVKLPENQQANVNLLQTGAGDWLNSGGAQFYGGNTVAQPGQNITAGREAILGGANSVGGLIGTAQRGEEFWLDPNNIFDPSRIPGFSQAQKSVTQDVTRNLTEGILPGLRSGSVASGTYGGSRQGIGEGLAVGRTSDALAKELGTMQMGAFDRGLSQYNQAQNRLPQTINNATLPGQIQNQVGEAQRADEQANINAARERWDYEQNAPLLALQQLQALTGTAGTYGGTSTTTNTQKTGFNPMQLVGLAGMAAGGAGSLGWKPLA